MKPANPATYKRAAAVLGAIVVTASFSGYFMGLQQTGSQLNKTQTMSLAAPHAEDLTGDTNATQLMAGSYSEQDRRVFGPNASWSNHISKLVSPVIATRMLTNVSDAQRSEALKERAARRAYDGAPPVAPHPISQDSAAVCLACHGEGMIVKDRIASKMSHQTYASCTQCHVPSTGLQLLADPTLLEPLASNEFAGFNAPLKGSRAWPQAPPTVPHGTTMRSDCLSCHGPNGLFGLRTPHPDRKSCLQCHVPSAEADQRNFLATFPDSNPKSQPPL